MLAVLGACRVKGAREWRVQPRNYNWPSHAQSNVKRKRPYVNFNCALNFCRCRSFRCSSVLRPRTPPHVPCPLIVRCRCCGKVATHGVEVWVRGGSRFVSGVGAPGWSTRTPDLVTCCSVRSDNMADESGSMSDAASAGVASIPGLPKLTFEEISDLNERKVCGTVNAQLASAPRPIRGESHALHPHLHRLASRPRIRST